MIMWYVALGLSVLVPVYTYVLYPYVLGLFPKKYTGKNEWSGERVLKLSIVVVANTKTKEQDIQEKVASIKMTNCSLDSDILVVRNLADEIKKVRNGERSDIIVFTDCESEITETSISELISSFHSPQVGCVCGMVRKRPDVNGKSVDGANWVYENKIKSLESGIGSLSGGNSSLMAVKRELCPEYLDPRINWDFSISTYVAQLGYDILFESRALAYEKNNKSDAELFKKHINDAVGYYRSIRCYWRLLLPRKGSFVFWSHRVLKWLVPFDLIFVFFISIFLAKNSSFFSFILLSQIIGYTYLLAYDIFVVSKNKKINNIMGRMSEFGCYFMQLQIAWICGFFKSFN